MDVFNSLPSHFAGRIRDIDNLLSKVITEIHSALTLSIHEISVSSPSALGQLEDSEEWDVFMSDLRKTIVEFRKTAKMKMKRLHSVVELPHDAKYNIEAYINGDSKTINSVTGITDYPVGTKQGLSEIAALLGTEAENKIDHMNQEKTIKVLRYLIQGILTNIEAETSYVETFLLRKTERVKTDIARCWSLLRKDQKQTQSINPVYKTGDDSLIVRQLKATFKFFGPHKLIKNIISLESTLHRIALTDDEQFIYAGGNGCKVRRRDVQVQANNIFTDKSRRVLNQSTMCLACLWTAITCAGSMMVILIRSLDLMRTLKKSACSMESALTVGIGLSRMRICQHRCYI